MADNETDAGFGGLNIPCGGHIDAVCGRVATVATTMLAAVKGHDIARGATEIRRAEAEIGKAGMITIGIPR